MKKIKTQKKLISLSRLLKYKNQYVIDRFKKELGVSNKFATTVFEDMLRYLWLSAKLRKHGIDFGMHEFFIVIDEIWHMFILYSFDYEQFSKKYFGKFIYHQPELYNKALPILSPTQIERELREQMEAVYLNLGPKVFQRWYDFYPLKFSKIEIAKMRLAAAKAKIRK